MAPTKFQWSVFDFFFFSYCYILIFIYYLFNFLTVTKLKQHNKKSLLILKHHLHCFSSQDPGYSAEMRKESLDAYEFPSGSEWQKLIKNGFFKI